jgi:hypothetical protein
MIAPSPESPNAQKRLGGWNMNQKRKNNKMKTTSSLRAKLQFASQNNSLLMSKVKTSASGGKWCSFKYNNPQGLEPEGVLVPLPEWSKMLSFQVSSYGTIPLQPFPSRSWIMTYSWYKSYKAAILETDWTTMPERLRSAELEIFARQGVLSLDHGGSLEERRAIAGALRGIGQTRTDVYDWQISKRLQRASWLVWSAARKEFSEVIEMLDILEKHGGPKQA